MTWRKVSSILTATLLAATVSACSGGDADETPPPPTEGEIPEQQTVTQEATEAPTTDEATATASGDDDAAAAIQDYADAFVEASDSGDQAALEQMATAEALDQVDTWAGQGYEWGDPQLVDDVQPGQVLVAYPVAGEDALTLQVILDPEAVAAGEDQAVLVAEVVEGLPPMTPAEYADQLVLENWPTAADDYTVYAMDNITALLAEESPEGWEQTDVSDGEDEWEKKVTYTRASDGQQLVVTVSTDAAENGFPLGVTDAEFLD